MKTIVVGYESTEASNRAVVRAAEVAEAFSARLVVVSVAGSPHVPVRTSPLEPAAPEFVAPGVAGPVALDVPVPPDHAPPAPDELAKHELEGARMALAGRGGVEAEYLAEIGDAAERLLEVADQRDADLIVVGSRERGFLERLLGHSVDETVARRADRDVLLVH